MSDHIQATPGFGHQAFGRPSLAPPPIAAPPQAPVSSGYRARRAPDRGMRAMTIAAAGLGGALVLAMGVWGMMGREPRAVPVFEADNRPLRIRPDNPGGMQVSGADDAVMGGEASGKERLAPPAEMPAPQALRAQLPPAPPAAAETTPAPVPAAPASAPPASVSQISAPPTAATPSPLPDTPAAPRKEAAAAAPATVAPPAAPRPVSAAASGAMVQLAAVQSEAAAQSEWQRLSKRLPGLLGDRQPVLQRSESNGRPFWRVRTGGFADSAAASGFCNQVKAKGGNCAVAAF